MQTTTMVPTEQVDAFLSDPRNCQMLAREFANWLNRRANAAAEAREVLSAPLATEDAENGLTKEGIAYGLRARVAPDSPWSFDEAEDAGVVDAALLVWITRVQAARAEAGRIPAWLRCGGAK
jgi:hypothetical protein